MDLVNLRIILEKPPAGVDFGLQKGSGNAFEVIQKQRSGDQDLVFELEVKVKQAKDLAPDFAGPFVNGPAGERFIYLDIGTIAGQWDSIWSRRLKIPLRGITWEMLKVSNVLTTTVPGTAKDGGPNCATVKPFDGWKVL